MKEGPSFGERIRSRTGWIAPMETPLSSATSSMATTERQSIPLWAGAYRMGRRNSCMGSDLGGGTQPPRLRWGLALVPDGLPHPQECPKQRGGCLHGTQV